jgi:hypothetical protein
MTNSNAEGKIVTRNTLTIDLREYIDEAKADGLNITRKQVLADIKELEANGFLKVIKKIDKNRFLVENFEPPSNENLLPGFEPSKF